MIKYFIDTRSKIKDDIERHKIKIKKNNNNSV